MDFKTIIILIIVFNVVTAIVKWRAKKSQQQGNEGEVAIDEQEFEHEEAPETPRQVVRGGSVSEEGFDDEETLYSRQSYKTPPKIQPQTASDERKPETGKAAGLGRNLLEQLAKELGLQLPDSTKPIPKPAKTVAPLAKPEMVSKPATKWIRQDEFEEPTLVKASEDDLPKTGGSRKRHPQFNALVKDSQALQNAFVLKEIIDPPLALRRK